MISTLAAIFVLAVFARAAAAQGPGTASVSVAPVDGKHRGIVLRAQTVDATIFERDDVVWADTRIWMRLRNPASKAITVSVTLPGPRVYAGDLPADLSLTLGGVPIPLTPGPADAGVGGPTVRAALPLAAGKDASLELKYRQALPQTDGMAVFAYLSTTARQWARSPEGVRVTIRFAPPITPEQILSIAPPPHQRSAGALSWHWAGERELLNVGIALMAPSWWEGLRADRARASEPGAGVDAHLALSERYRSLAHLPALPFENADFHDRFFPAATGTIETALRSARLGRNPNWSEPDAALLHSRLASLYEERAVRAGGEQRSFYTQAATDQVALGAPDQVPSAGDLKRKQTLAQAALAVERKDFATARRLAADALGPAAVEPQEVAPPLVSGCEIEVSTTESLRRVTLALVDGRAPGSGAALLREVADIASKQRGVLASLEPERLVIEMPYTDGVELRRIQRDLADRIPDRPELALLRDVLSPAELAVTRALSPIQEMHAYTEQISLQASKELWDVLALRLEDASNQATPTAELEGDATAIQAALRREDAAAWRQLVGASRVLYRISLPGGHKLAWMGQGRPDGSSVSREWMVRPGAARLLSGRSAAWRSDRLPLAAAGGAGALLIPAAALAVVAAALTRPRRG